MIRSDTTAPELFFLAGGAGPVSALYFPPTKEKPSLGGILHAPAFAEEMNRSRHLVARQAREFSRLGYAVLLVDYFGTGDSQGDFREGRWEIWHADLAKAVVWLRERTEGALTLWGLRFGCLLALDLVSAGGIPVERLLLWHPVTQGELMMTQFLRLRLAADMAESERKRTTADLRNQLADGASLEIGGYELTQELVAGIDRAVFPQWLPPDLKKVFWLEMGGSKERPVSPVARRFVDQWQSQETEVVAESVIDEPFWAPQERAFAPALIARTTALLAPES